MPWEGGGGRGGQAEVFQGWMLMSRGDHSVSKQPPFGEQSLKGGREWVTSLIFLETAMTLSSVTPLKGGDLSSEAVEDAARRSPATSKKIRGGEMSGGDVMMFSFTLVCFVSPRELLPVESFVLHEPRSLHQGRSEGTSCLGQPI